MYAAATGCRRVVKINAGGKVETVLKAERPWSPTGVALHGDAIYVLEYPNANGENTRTGCRGFGRSAAMGRPRLWSASRRRIGSASPGPPPNLALQRTPGRRGAFSFDSRCSRRPGPLSLVDRLRPHRGISQERLPLYLGFFEFVHNVRRRGKALLGSLIGLLVAPRNPG